MRIPFLSGLVDRTRNRTRILFSSGNLPEPIPGPWKLKAVVRDEDMDPRAAGPGSDSTSSTPPYPTPPGAPPES